MRSEQMTVLDYATASSESFLVPTVQLDLGLDVRHAI